MSLEGFEATTSDDAEASYIDILATIPQDKGCAHYSRCTECPLFDCYLVYVDEEDPQMRGSITRAIQHSWARGLRHPSFWWKYRGDEQFIPLDVLNEHGGRAHPDREGAPIAPDELERIGQLRVAGNSHARVAFLLRRTKEAVRAAEKRYRQRERSSAY